MRRHDQRAAGPERLLEREHHADRSAADPSERAQGRVHEKGHPLRDAKRTQIRAQRVDRGRRLPRGIDAHSRSLMADMIYRGDRRVSAIL